MTFSSGLREALILSISRAIRISHTTSQQNGMKKIFQSVRREANIFLFHSSSQFYTIQHKL
jgi:hypothetical protein